MSASDILAPVESLLRQSGAATVAGVLLYAACILLALVQYRACGPQNRARPWWLMTACCLAMLGCIEALGIPAKIVDAVRMFSIAQGWYNERGNLQVEFIVAFTVLWTLILFSITPLLPRGCGLCGTVRALGLLPAFIIIRAASLHELDYFFRLCIAGLVRMSSLIEAIILILILWQLIRAYRMGIPGKDSPGYRHNTRITL